MAGQERIDDIIDLSSSQRQVDALLNMLESVDSKIKSVSKLTLGYTQTGNGSDLKKYTDDLTRANEEMARMQKNLAEQAANVARSQEMFGRSISENIAQLNRMKNTMESYKTDLKEDVKLLKDGTISRDEYNKRLTQTNQKLQEYKIRTAELNQVLNAQQKQHIATSGSIDEMSQRLGLMRDAYRSLSEEQRKSATGKEMLIQIQQLDTQVKELDASMGNHQRNVGNYSSALTGYANVLRGLRGPTKLLGEALGISAMAADQLRLVIEHSIQGFAAYFRSKEKNKAAAAANAAAETEEAAAHATTTTAMETEAGAAEVATGATNGLTAAIGALLLPIAVIIAAVGVLADVIYNWVTADKRAMEAEKSLAEAHEAVLDSIKNGIDDTRLYNDIRMRGLKQELAAMEASGASHDKLLAKKEEIARAEKYNAEVITKTQDVTNESLNKTIAQYDKAAQKVEALNKKIEMGQVRNTVNQSIGAQYLPGFLRRGLGIDEDIDGLKEKRDAAQKTMEGLKKQRDLYIDVLKTQSDDTYEIEKQDLEHQRYNEDEARKLRLAKAENRVTEIKSANQIIISSEKTGLQERLIAMADNTRAEIEYLNRQQKEIESNTANIGVGGGLTKSALAELSKLETQKTVLTKESLAARQKVIAEDAQKRFEIEVQTNNARLQNNIDINKQVLSDEQSSFSQKLDALGKNLAAEFSIENNNYEMRRSKIKADDEKAKKEKELLQVEHEKKMTDITMKGESDRLKLIVSSIKEQADRSNVKINIRATEHEMGQLDKLHNKYMSGKATLEDYNRQKEKLQKMVAFSVLDQEDAVLENEQKRLKEAGLQSTKMYLDIENQITQNHKKQQELRNSIDEKEKQDRIKKFKDTFDEIVGLAEKTSSIISSAANGRFTDQKNQVQELENAQQIRYEKEVKDIQRSSATEQEKATGLIILEKQRQAQAQANAREQKKIDLDKAKFDKEMAIFNIIINTASAVVKALPNIPLAIATGVLGAAELTVAASQPLPKYATGRSGGRAEMALTDELGPELYIESSGKMYMGNDKPTLRYLNAGTQIIPHDQVNEVLYGLMMQKTAGMIVEEKGGDINELKDMMVWQTNKLAAAYRERQQPVVKVINNTWMEYYHRQIKE